MITPLKHHTIIFFTGIVLRPKNMSQNIARKVIVHSVNTLTSSLACLDQARLQT